MPLKVIQGGLAESLSSNSVSTLPDPFKDKNARVYVFIYERTKVTIRVQFNDRQSGADAAITNITTLPRVNCCKGYGTKALQCLLEVFKEEGLTNIQAVQVQQPSHSFWVKNGFYPLKNTTNDYRLGVAP